MGKEAEWRKGEETVCDKEIVLTREVSQSRVMLDPNPPTRACSISMGLGKDQAFS